MKILAMITGLALCATASPAAEPFHKTLTSARLGVHVDTWEQSGHFAGAKGPVWSVRKITLHGGKQEGVDIVIIDNGVMKISVIPTRGMGVFSVTSGDVRLGWDSPVKEVVNPQNINLQSRGGLGWLEGFNEWLVRCGLESNGHPGTDKFTNNVGEEATMDLTLHGKIANIPASEVEVIVDSAPPYRIHLRGRVDERMFYGPKLELQTEISTEAGSTSFRIQDVITNRGAQEQEFELLYHTNYGRPLLEEGSTFLAAASRVTPFNDHAAKDIAHYAEYAAPALGFVEQVYCLQPIADKDGRTLIALQNKARDRAVSLAFPVEDLPYVTLWKNTNAEGEGYVTGLEPGTNFPANRRIERAHGRVPKLAAGASRTATIDFTIHTSAEDTKRLADQIAALQGDVKPVLDETPEKKD
ncbi:MAG: aldose 1-epimerase family protein [Chthoniobacter sp.]|uniref:aldose 1-epimerase family protein n=1 Tax=Chthoniobacter sp. TaxID=2510640 RepID=UPI0032AE6146